MNETRLETQFGGLNEIPDRELHDMEAELKEMKEMLDQPMDPVVRANHEREIKHLEEEFEAK